MIDVTAHQQTAEKFIRWLHARCERALAQIHLKKYGCNLKCPQCQQWTYLYPSESMGTEDGRHIIKCGCCHRQTKWICEAGFWISVS